jgi:hypothetical protein
MARLSTYKKTRATRKVALSRSECGQSMVACSSGIGRPTRNAPAGGRTRIPCAATTSKRKVPPVTLLAKSEAPIGTISPK